jgi:ribose-phosphate pyrophosphokinase
MKTICFATPGNEELTNQLTAKMGAEKGEVIVRHFPDEETYVRILSDVKDKRVVIVCTLHQPDDKLLTLYFISQTAKSLGAACTCLVAPYLAYMRQDKVFNQGEGITSEYFGKFISQFADSIITVDPHLHRRTSLSEIYSVPNAIVHAAPILSKWIKENIDRPLIVGPDSESEQWVKEVATEAKASYIILEKIRHGDRNVEISIPHVDQFSNHTPVLVDDIISTAKTMIETINHLKKVKMKSPVCIGVHAVFADNAYEDLLNAGAAQVITCNTIPHTSNKIDLTSLLASSVETVFKHEML